MAISGNKYCHACSATKGMDMRQSAALLRLDASYNPVNHLFIVVWGVGLEPPIRWRYRQLSAFSAAISLFFCFAKNCFEVRSMLDKEADSSSGKSEARVRQQVNG
jgi:hypothetical protein